MRLQILATCVLLPACTPAQIEAPRQASTSVQATMPISNAWETQETEAYRGKRDDIAFANSTHGWYGTGKGDLYATTNGGETWAKIFSKPGTFIRALGFVDEKIGFLGNVGTDYYPGVTDENPLYRTEDGGRSWQAADLGGETIKGVCAIDITQSSRIYQGELRPRTIIHAAGRVGGPTGILRSVDGGENWQVIDMSKHAGMILDIKFFDEMNGLVFASSSRGADNEGLILRTSNGGESWSEVYRSGRQGELIWKASFPTSETGFATVQNYDTSRAEQLIVKTEDGGRSWQELALTMNASARQFGIGFVDERRGWVGTMAGGFYTDDGGQSFTAVPVAKAANKFRVVSFEGGAHVFAIGTEVQKLSVVE